MSGTRPVANLVEHNQRLFGRLSRALSSGDPVTYVEAVRKLAQFLNNERAYYRDARPEIYQLLMLASKALRQALGIAEDVHIPFDQSAYPENPLVQAYNALLRTVEPFLHHFEDDLRKPLQNFVMGTPSGSARHTPVITPAVQSSTTLPTSPAFDAKKENNHNHAVQMAHEGSSQTPKVLSRVPSQTPPVEVPPSSSAMTNKSTTPVSGQAPVAKTKVKKKKNIDFNLLVQHDIKGLLEKKKSHGIIGKDGLTSDRASPAQTTPTITRISTPPVSMATDMDSTDVKSAKLSVNEDNAPQQDTIMPTVPLEKALPGPSLEPPLTEQPVVTRNEDLLPDIQQTSYAMTVDQEIPDVREVAEKAQDQGVQITDSELQKPSRATSPRNLPTTSDGSMLDSSLLDALSIQELTTRDINPTQMEVDMVVAPDPAIHGDSTVVPPGALSGQDSGIDPMDLVDYSNGIFGTEMLVVATQQGMKKGHHISFQFEIPDARYQSVLNWINLSDNVASSLCFTLGCYLTADLAESAKKTDCTTFERQLSSTRPTWPVHGGLAMNANFNGSRAEFPLSPPFRTTPENLVDVSPFLVTGNNLIELIPRRDLSQYTLVLHAHFPTKAQLQEVEVCKQKEKEWKNWLNYMSRPLKILFKTFDSGAFQQSDVS